MIVYERGGLHFFLKIFQRKGSVFPFAFLIAFPCALVTAGIASLEDTGSDYFAFVRGDKAILNDSSAWSSINFLVGFLIVFRTSIAYSRFWEGCYSTHMMRAEWFDACSSLLAFCKHSTCEAEKVRVFQELMVRLFSLLHAVALSEIEDVAAESEMHEVMAFKYELMDVSGLDLISLEAVRDSENRVELVFQWIQQCIVENISTDVLSIPPPILSRAFQELSTGMVHFHDAIKLSNIPFPFPYAQTCDCLLTIHWLITPFLVTVWAAEPYWAGIFSFVSVFILWCLNCIAVEIENPFGRDSNDIDAHSMQIELNSHLELLLSPAVQRTPTLVSHDGDTSHATPRSLGRRASLHHMWQHLATSNLEGSDDTIVAPVVAVSQCAQLKRGSTASTRKLSSGGLLMLRRARSSLRSFQSSHRTSKGSTSSRSLRGSKEKFKNSGLFSSWDDLDRLGGGTLSVPELTHETISEEEEATSSQDGVRGCIRDGTRESTSESDHLRFSDSQARAEDRSNRADNFPMSSVDEQPSREELAASIHL